LEHDPTQEVINTCAASAHANIRVCMQSESSSIRHSVGRLVAINLAYLLERLNRTTLKPRSIAACMAVALLPTPANAHWGDRLVSVSWVTCQRMCMHGESLMQTPFRLRSVARHTPSHLCCPQAAVVPPLYW
jgi:hypothetical protein